MSKKKSKLLTWSDVRKFNKIPKRKLNLLTDEFLQDLKLEVKKIFKNDDETYWGTYIYLEETGGFDDALKNVCEKYNVKNAIYDFCNSTWYDREWFTGEIVSLMKDRGIIEEGVYEDNLEEDLNDMKGEIVFYKLIKPYKGYNVVTNDWCFKKDVEEYREDYRKGGYIMVIKK